MAESIAKPKERQPLSQRIAQRNGWSLSDRLELARRIVLQLQSLHHDRRTHRAIGLGTVCVDAEDHVYIDAPPASRCFGGEHIDPEFCPPEMAGSPAVELPVHLSEAAEVLRQAGLTLDPRRIDFYQLGTLLCHLLIAEPVRAFLLAPQVKDDTPAAVRPLLVALLGDGHDPLVDADGVLAAVDDAVERITATVAFTSTRETPAGGGVLGAAGDTPPVGDPTLQPPASDAADQGRSEKMQLPFQRLGHFRITAQLGRGGMGDVYLGWDESLQRRVAIKVLPPEFARDEKLVRRFHTESTAAAKLNHENVVQVYFSGEDQGLHYFAMQYVEGESLADRLKREGRLPVDETFDIVEKCLDGLAAAHKAGLIHRDIKPANVLISARSGHPVLVDFGLVRTEGQGAGGVTATGVIMGTADYIAPEQARGKTVDGRADIYSLGILAYQVLSGQLPFRAESATAMLFQHAFEAPAPLGDIVPDVPEAVVQIVERMMEKNPADRYPTAAAAKADVYAFRQGRPLAAPGAAPDGSDQAVSRTGQSLAPKSGDFGDEDPAATALTGTSGEQTELPEDFDALASEGHWQQVQDWAATMFRRHAPEVVQRLQGTTQQIDAAVALYQRRHRRLVALLEEARGLLGELNGQRDAHRAAAAAAAQQATTPDDEQGRAALNTQAECEAQVAAIDHQLAEQQPQVDNLEQQLCEVDATLARLQSQRDNLQARLRAAQARQEMETARPRRRLMPSAVLAVIVAGVTVAGILCILVATGLWRWDDTGKTLLPGTSTGPSTGRGAIAGRVFTDDNTDGAPGPGEAGLAGWMVELASLGRRRRTLPSPTPASPGRYGYSIAVVGDNLLIGDPDDGTDGKQSGIAYLVNPASGEVVLTLRNPSPEKGDWFGWCTAAVGDNLLITSIRDNTGATNAGIVYLFDGQTGELRHTFLNPSPGGDDNFGRPLATSDKFIVIGSPKDDAGPYNCGAVYVFDAETYELRHMFADPTQDAFAWHGNSVGIAGDKIVVGASLDDTDAGDAGMAYVYDAGTGELVHRIHSPQPLSKGVFGDRLTTVGDKFAIRRVNVDAAGNKGLVDVFHIESGQWLYTLKDPKSDAGPKFGNALSAAGNNLLVGADSGNVAYLFDANTGALLNTFEGAPESYFGFSVAGGDGTIMIGAPDELIGGVDAGAVHLFDAQFRATTTRTANDGSYRFSQLPPGKYRLRAIPPVGGGQRNSPRYGQIVEIQADGVITANLPVATEQEAKVEPNEAVTTTRGCSTTRFGTPTATSGLSTPALQKPVGQRRA